MRRDTADAAYGLEYLLLGLATAFSALLVGSVAAWLVVTELINLSFVWLPGPALGRRPWPLAVTVGFGLAGTFTRARAKASLAG